MTVPLYIALFGNVGVSFRNCFNPKRTAAIVITIAASVPTVNPTFRTETDIGVAGRGRQRFHAIQHLAHRLPCTEAPDAE